MKKSLKEKYKKELGWDEKVFLFALKVTGSTGLFLIGAASADAYRFFY